MGKDFYSVLDIDPETDKEEIRQAYVHLARQYHPDVSKDPDARERFEEINLAYKVLSDDENRIFYNLYYKGAQHVSDCQEPLTWWQRYELAVSKSILVLGSLVWMGLWLGLMVWLVAQF
jgi:curved DNA-binding protein